LDTLNLVTKLSVGKRKELSGSQKSVRLYTKRKSPRVVRQGIGGRMTKTMMPERCGGGSSSKGVVCEGLRRVRGRKTDGVQQSGAITPGDHVPGSKILHRSAKGVKFH
jgi:hypothetical protein